MCKYMFTVIYDSVDFLSFMANESFFKNITAVIKKVIFQSLSFENFFWMLTMHLWIDAKPKQVEH